MRRNKTSTFSMAGWLFADLFLGLMIIFMVANIGNASGVKALGVGTFVPRPTPTNTIPPTYTPYPTQTPLPTLTPFPTYTPFPTALPTALIGLDQIPISIRVGPQENLIAAVQPAEKANPGSRVGLLITFGYSRSVGDGVQAAQRASAALQQAFPDWIAQDTPTKDLSWFPDASGDEGTLRLEFYLIRQIVKSSAP